MDLTPPKIHIFTHNFNRMVLLISWKSFELKLTTSLRSIKIEKTACDRDDLAFMFVEPTLPEYYIFVENARHGFQKQSM